MSIGNSELKKLVRSPEGFDSLGKCLLKVIQRQPILGFFCFSEFERDIYIYPPVPSQKESQALSHLLKSDWRENAMDVFPQVFELLEIPTGPGGFWVQSSFLASGVGEKPIGAYAYVLDRRTDRDIADIDYRSVDLLLGELIRCRLAIHKYRETFHEGDYLYTLVNKLGCMLLNPGQRQQALVTLVEMAVHVARADVGLLLVRKADEFHPEVELGLSPELVRHIRFLPDSETLFDRLTRTGHPLIIDDFSGPSIQIPHPYRVRINGLMAIPLTADGTMIGMLCVAGGESGQELSSKMIETLETISAVTSIAVENDILRHSGLGISVGDEGAGTLQFDFLEGIFEDSELGIVLSDARCKILYMNETAGALLGRTSATREGGETNERPRLRWLESQWRQGRDVDDVDFPFHGLSGRGVKVSIEVINRRPGAHEDDLFVTRLKEDASASDASVQAQAAGEFTELLARAQLGSDLLVQLCSAPGEDAARLSHVDQTAAIVDRSLRALARGCEDLRLATATLGEDTRRICSLESLVEHLRKAIDAERLDVELRTAPDFTAASVLVLGDPFLLKGALVRVLVEAERALSEQRDVTLSARHAEGQIGLRFSFEGGRNARADIDSQGPTRGRSREVRLGLKVATRIIATHGGQIRSGATRGGRSWIEVSLPIAPGADSIREKRRRGRDGNDR